MEIEKALYDSIGTGRLREFNLSIRARLFDKYYLPHLVNWGLIKEKAQYAEVGCGFGDKTRKIQRILPNNSTIIGLDNAQSMLNKAQEKHPSIAFFKSDARTLEGLKNHHYDALFYFQVLHHFDEQELRKALSRAKSKIKPDGHIVIIDSLEREKIIQNIVFRFMEREYAVASIKSDAYQCLNKVKLKEITHDQGLEIVFETGQKWPYIISEMVALKPVL